ncbi:MAG: DNA polymerase I [Lachnospiraceae bacterium]|nr:DNA polymerase I [Lachnospiraceae bacterium]
MSERILLIDGHSILNRAFYGLPNLTNSEGLHTNGIYGFLNILLKTLEEEGPQYLAVAFDLSAPTFRHKRYDKYKGTRKPMPEELKEQVPALKEVLAAMGIHVVSLEGYEADDVLGTLAKKSEAKGMEVTVLSGDRDLLQLATDRIKIRIPKTSRGNTTIEDYLADQVKEKYQVTPPQIVELKALMGDSSDNIPGIPGVGEKTATKMVVQFGSIENAYANLEQVVPKKARESLRDHYDMAQLSKELATIDVQAPVVFSYEEAKIGELYTPEAYEMFQRLDFKNLLGRFSQDMQETPAQKNFLTCQSEEQAREYFSQAAREGSAGIWIFGRGEELGAVCLAWGERAVYFPVEAPLSGEFLTAQIEALAEHASLAAMDVKRLLHFLPFLKEGETFDAGVAAYLLNPLKSHYTYEDIGKEYLGLFAPSREETLGKMSDEEALKSQPEALMQVGCYMAYIAQNARKPLENALRKSGMESVFRDIEMPLVRTLYEMEREGIQVKAQSLAEYGQRLVGRIQELEEKIWQQAGENFNINSPKQLGVILFEKMGMPGGKKTKTGYSTAADVLDKLACDHEIVRDILEYRQLAKLKSTYADGLLNFVDETGRIHSHFNQTITATGRISSTEPNLQNIPVRMELGRLIRKVFVPREGCVFLDADYSQIELRVLAHMSKDEKLIQAYREAQDIHRLTASQVFHVPFEQVTDLQRRNAKAVNFGIVYGISSFGLSQDLSISRKEAADYIQSYFETYPQIKGFLDGLVEQGKSQGYVSTMFGRRRPIPELKSSNYMQRGFGERIAMNSPIQGSAADIIKIAMNRVRQRLSREGLRSRLVLQIHDELLVETWIDETEAVSRILEEEMKSAAHLSVALEVDMHQGNSWYEAK